MENVIYRGIECNCILMNQCSSCIIGIEPIAMCLYLLRWSSARRPNLFWTLKHANEIASIIFSPFHLERRSRQRRCLTLLLAVSFLLVLPCVILTIFAGHALLQNLQARKVLQGCGVLSFFLWRFASRARVFSSSSCLTPVLTMIFQAVLSSANFSQVFASMWHLVRLLLHVSLNLSFGRPLSQLP